MANSKISSFPSGDPVQSGDQIPVVRAGANFKVSASALGALSKVVVTPSAAQVRAVGSTPIVLVAGVAGKVFVPLSALVSCDAVGHHIYGPGSFGSVAIKWRASADQPSSFPGGALGGVVNKKVMGTANGPGNLFGNDDYSVYAGSDLVVDGLGNDWSQGDPLTWQVGAGGAGYAPGDTGSWGNGSGNFTYTVTAVNGSGAVTAFTVTKPAADWATLGNNHTNISTGVGNGNFTINVLTFTQGDAPVTITLVYYVV